MSALSALKSWSARVAALTCAATLFGCERSPLHAQESPSSPVDIPAATKPPAKAQANADQAQGSPSLRPSPYALGFTERGVFAQFDAQVRLHDPSWLKLADRHHVAYMGRVFVVVDGAPVALSQLKPDDPRVIHADRTSSSTPLDADKDGLPDVLDLLVGAHKLTKNKAKYKATYEALAYPNGDVSAEIGVCTDVVVRAARNSGQDLQSLLQEDIKRAKRAYPMVSKANAHIDHRRVKTLLPYFIRHWQQLPAAPKDTSRAWLPGDILFMNTYGDKRPDHMGIVSDRLGPSGYPLVINNWTDGFFTSEMDILPIVDMTHRFRAPGAMLPVPKAHRGLDGVLKRRAITLDEEHRQLIVVTAPAWDSAWGQLRRFEREAAKKPWRQVGQPITVGLGSAGLGQGRGVGAPALSDGPLKREGDRRSPAGVFTLGTAFGTTSKAPYKGAWPWRQADARSRFVDDPDSPHYNTWMQAPAAGQAPWRSAEALSMYRLGLVVEHNTSPQPKAGAGSAIFIHAPMSKARSSTIGCTEVEERPLRELIGWLKPAHKPLLIQIPAQWW